MNKPKLTIDELEYIQIEIANTYNNTFGINMEIKEILDKNNVIIKGVIL